jgi:hypothetical protein
MRGIVLAAILAALPVGTASAWQEQATGSVTVLQTEPGSVLVLRAGQVYELKQGDAVFEGDTVFTRTNGALRFSIGGCDVGLGGQQSIEVQVPAVCSTVPTNLGYDAVFAGVAVGTGGDVAATPTLLLALLAGGGAAAAAAGGGGDDNGGPPASP